MAVAKLVQPHAKILSVFFLTALVVSVPHRVGSSQESLERRRESLRRLLPLLALHHDERGSDPRIWMEHQNWTDWQKTNGELPPDFATMPANADLPDPLVMQENGKEIRITTRQQWTEKREVLKQHIQHWIYGSMPPAPGNVRANILRTVKDGDTTIKDIELWFGPDHAARLTMQLIVPDGRGPFPVFMTQWNHRGWAAVGVR